MSRRSSEKYPGILDQPIPLIDSSCSEEERALLAGTITTKFLALLKYFEIKPGEDMFVKLAFALIEKHVPGFQPIDSRNRRGGKKPTFKAELGLELYALATRQVRETGKTETAAIEALRKLEPKFANFTFENLYRRYMELKNGNGKLLGWKQIIEDHAKTLGITEEQFEQFIFWDFLNIPAETT